MNINYEREFAFTIDCFQIAFIYQKQPLNTLCNEDKYNLLDAILFYSFSINLDLCEKDNLIMLQNIFIKATKAFIFNKSTVKEISFF